MSVPDVFEDQATKDAAGRLVAFLRGEIDELPRGHAWRGNYQRQLIVTLARYPELSAEE